MDLTWVDLVCFLILVAGVMAASAVITKRIIKQRQLRDIDKTLVMTWVAAVEEVTETQEIIRVSDELNFDTLPKAKLNDDESRRYDTALTSLRNAQAEVETAGLRQELNESKDPATLLRTYVKILEVDQAVRSQLELSEEHVTRCIKAVLDESCHALVPDALMGKREAFDALTVLLLDERLDWEKHLAFGYPEQWEDLVAMYVSQPATDTFPFLDSLDWEEEAASLPLLAAEALRRQSPRLCKYVFAYCCEDIDAQDAVGSIMFAELAKFVDGYNASRHLTEPR